MKFEIKSRWNGSVLFSVETESMKLAVELAVKAKADLRGAVLSDADLRGAVLRGAVLRGAVLRDAVLSDADLSGAVLRGAVLRGAVLRDAVLSGAVLSDADLRGAVLRGAVLRGAVLRDAVLSDADLSGADLSDAVLSDADLSGAVLRGAVLRGAVLPFIPKIEDLDGKILAALGREGCSLEMGKWHECETTHCRAGWAIHLAGDVGKVMEGLLGAACAGGLLYARAYPGMKVPDFYTSNEAALEDIKARAALAQKTEVAGK